MVRNDLNIETDVNLAEDHLKHVLQVVNVDNEILNGPEDASEGSKPTVMSMQLGGGVVQPAATTIPTQTSVGKLTKTIFESFGDS